MREPVGLGLGLNFDGDGLRVAVDTVNKDGDPGLRLQVAECDAVSDCERKVSVREDPEGL